MNVKEEIENRAFLVATYSGRSNRESCEEHLEELELLADTYGLITVGKECCPLRTISASTFLNKGKLQEIQETIKDLKADMIIFDEEISPAQQRNLEKVFGIEVMDRSELILGVFAQRAHTKEARLQVALAQARYQLPRLKRLWTHLSRQAAVGGGAGAYLRGTGEKQIEVDKRLLRKRIERLEKQMEEVKHTRQVQRTARMRSEIPTFAIVGYTNAGKSTLLNALTEADVFTEDKLFATLDTTTRKFTLSNNQEILLIDTVGFIRKIPHQLIAAFRSTLEEALQADILLHMIDVSHPNAEEQAEASYQVLKELNVENKPVITILNKIDKCQDQSIITKMRVQYPGNVLISAVTGEGFDSLEEMMTRELKKQRQVVDLCIPQSDYAIVSDLMQRGRILKKEYEGNHILIRADVSSVTAGRLKRFIIH